jgi:outer membrane protein OmpA-like peptidoglycan-associated protein/tetratricopeptide (TPR) repeat protein
MAHLSSDSQIHGHSMMKLFKLFIPALFLFAFHSNAQSQDYTTSDKKAVRSFENALNAFDARNYDLALALIEEALERESSFIEAHLLGFEVCTEMRDYDCAKKSLKKAIAIDPEFYANAHFYLGALEMNDGAYEDAKHNFERFLSFDRISPEMSEKANAELLNCMFALDKIENPVDFDPINLGQNINSPFPEYYPTITADDRQLIYTRLIDDPEAYRGKNEDFYMAFKDGDNWRASFPLSDINTSYNEGAPAISGDGRVLIYTACELFSEYGGNRQGFGSCDLFMSERQGNTWSPPVNLGPEVNTSAWESQPSLSADGQTIYFVRGYPTAYGNKEQDIHVAKRNADGTWGGAVKLPRVINSRGKEESAHIHPDGKTLYFSSNGHVGMGGLDIYVSQKMDSGKWSDPVNLGYPINTHKDENSLLVSPNGEIAYFASSRDGGFGNLDMYSFVLPKEVRPTPVTFAQGLVVDVETKKPVEAKLRLSAVSSQSLISQLNSDAVTGEFLIALPVGQTYALSVTAEGYLFHSENFSLMENKSNEPYALTVELQKIKAGSAIVLQNIFFDLDKDQMKIESLSELQELAGFLEANPEVRIEISGHTDNQGASEYNEALSLRRANAVKKHLVERQSIDASRLEAMGYGDSKPISSNDTGEGKAKNRRTEFKVL